MWEYGNCVKFRTLCVLKHSISIYAYTYILLRPNLWWGLRLSSAECPCRIHPRNFCNSCSKSNRRRNRSYVGILKWCEISHPTWLSRRLAADDNCFAFENKSLHVWILDSRQVSGIQYRASSIQPIRLCGVNMEIVWSFAPYVPWITL